MLNMVALCTAADRVLEFRMLLNLKRMLQFNWMDFCKWFFFQLSVLYPRWAFMYLVKCILYCFRSVCISLYSISAHKIKNMWYQLVYNTLLPIGYGSIWHLCLLLKQLLLAKVRSHIFAKKTTVNTFEFWKKH